ncbi:MAG: hypothetical protein J6A54_03745 [Clostridia bacterium]|nr:hypothetical protein [Clostridia bacterium]
MKLSEMFKRCLEIPYTHIDNSADYALERIENTLYIYLECSNGEVDWINNFDFPAKPYERMEEGQIWFAHRGFMRVFKSVEEQICDHVADMSLDSIITVGYSHGAALATLCHEYVWYNRPDLRKSIEGYAFASPRVIWGAKLHSLTKRWDRFLVIRNINDIVTHVPPKLLGYTHVGHLLEIGKRGKYSMTDAHRPENILNELLIYERENPYLYE